MHRTLMSRSFSNFVLALSLVCPAFAGPVLNEVGSLQALLESTPIPSAASADKYRLPTESERDDFRAALLGVLVGDLPTASDFAVGANYDVVDFEDTDTNDHFTLLREKDTNQHWGGLYVIDQTPERALVVQCPHPLYDGVRVPAVDLFMDTNAVAYFQAGTHRNNSLTPGVCDGDLHGEDYRISDMAHAPDSLFQVAHEVVEDYYDRTVSLSFHGMGDGSDPADVVISNGTPRVFLGNSLSRSLATRMLEILADAADPRVAVSHQEPGEDPGLSGSNNTQGRASNGSHDLCLEDAPSAIFPERFIHLESDPDVRSGDPSNWQFVIQAFIDRIPLFSDPIPDHPAGDLTITEVMANPNQVGDGTGEYLELFNHTDAPIDMTGWTIFDRSLNTADFSGIIQPGDLFVVGVSGDLNGGALGGVPDAVWADDVGDMTLTNSSDIISILDDNGDLVASVSYEDGDPYGSGVALELAIGNGHPNGQTSGPNYLASVEAFGADTGSPGIRGESQYPLSAATHDTSYDAELEEITLTFSSVLAVTYQLRKTNNLTDWSAVGGVGTLIGNDEEREFDFPLPLETEQFYRIQGDYAAPY